MNKFFNDVKQFNEMYRLPCEASPLFEEDDFLRIIAFDSILTEELAEIADIITMLTEQADHLDIMTGMADLLVDIQVYCASELTKYGLAETYQRLPSFHAFGPYIGVTPDSIESTLYEFRLICEYLQILKDTTGSNDRMLAVIGNTLSRIIDRCTDMMEGFGMPNDVIRNIIMESNFSKQNPDGSTTYDERGKVQKGSNYWKPEPKIKEALKNVFNPIV